MVGKTKKIYMVVDVKGQCLNLENNIGCLSMSPTNLDQYT